MDGVYVAEFLDECAVTTNPQLRTSCGEIHKLAVTYPQPPSTPVGLSGFFGRDSSDLVIFHINVNLPPQPVHTNNCASAGLQAFFHDFHNAYDDDDYK